VPEPRAKLQGDAHWRPPDTDTKCDDEIMRAALSLLACLLGGCVLLVTPDPGGEHCQFAGEDTTCGKCARAQCQVAIDDACGAADEEVLTALEDCALNRGPRCHTLLSSTTRPLATCLEKRCSGACAPRPFPSTTRCAPLPVGDGRECSCTTAQPATDYVCSEAAIARTICCAPRGWPAEGLSCSCLPLNCSPTPTGCSCFLAFYGTSGESCAGEICCAVGATCRCSTKECAPGTVRVDRCDVSKVSCETGQDRVSSCTVPR